MQVLVSLRPNRLFDTDAQGSSRRSLLQSKSLCLGRACLPIQVSWVSQYGKE